MVEYLQSLSGVMQTFPGYMGKGVMELAIVIVGGLVVGYVTSKYLYRINEINKIEGWMLEKRIPIYQELFNKTEEMMHMYQVAPDTYDLCVSMLERHGLQAEDTTRQVSSLFMDVKRAQACFLEFDSYASQNKLFLDEAMAQELNVFQNYFALIHRMLVVFEEQMVQHKIQDLPSTKAMKENLLLTLGIYLSEEFLDKVQVLQNTIRLSMGHLQIAHRKKPDYSYDYYEHESGYMMSRLKDSKAVSARDGVMMVLTEYTAMAIAAVDLKSRKRK